MFWDLYLPKGRALPLDMVRDKMGGWINAVQDLHTTDPVLRKTMLALSLTTVGKSLGDKDMVRAGTEFYGEALGEASTALKSGGNKSNHALLAAIRLFAVYEILHGSDNRDLPPDAVRSCWRAHAVGEFAYVGAQEPSSFASHHAHQLFIDGRLYLACLAIRGRTRTYLTTEPWMKDPWTVHKKTPRDLIIDIFLMLPGLFQDFDMLQYYPYETRNRLSSHLAQRCLDIQDRLRRWHDLYAATPHLATVEEDVPDAIKAHDLAVAHLMSLYWTTGLLCTDLLNSLVGQLSEPPFLTHPRPSALISSAFVADDLCRNIINVLPVCLHPDAGIFRTSIIAMQLGAATLHLSIIPPDQMLEERRWFVHNLQKPECVAMADFVWSLKCVGSELFVPMSKSSMMGTIPADIMCEKKDFPKNLPELVLLELRSPQFEASRTRSKSPAEAVIDAQ